MTNAKASKKLEPERQARKAAKKANKQAAQDESIIGTNDSSTISKRSVEKYFLPKPHFLRYFVSNYRRRSPLIHRGYWLRMRAVQYIVDEFIWRTTPNVRKVVINLGCGYDTLPFKLLARDAIAEEDVLFVDVDYPDLIKKKTETILTTPQLREKLEAIVESPISETVYLSSKNYLAIGCDLRDFSKLTQTLEHQELGKDFASLMFIAEVSLTYIDIGAANRLIAWAGEYPNARFCLLEQCIPNGNEHPFAKTMIGHFDRLNSPLKSITRYPRIEDQERRFFNAGWPGVDTKSLWDLWTSTDFLSSSERAALNIVEQFDEWEEFALFASHYFCLVASTSNIEALDGSTGGTIGLFRLKFRKDVPHDRRDHVARTRSMALTCDAQTATQRRYGALYPTQENALQFTGGFGPQGRLNSTDSYITGSADNSSEFPPASEMPYRMCHTVTSLKNNFDCLLTGGRKSPNEGLADCWLRREGKWKKTDDLPNPRYRHSAILFTDPDGVEGVLVYGGKVDSSTVLASWLVWHEQRGWIACKSSDCDDASRFGANLVPQGPRNGYILGGMGQDGTIITKPLKWTLRYKGVNPYVDVEPCGFDPGKMHKLATRFGASSVATPMGTFLVGGFQESGVLSSDYEIVNLLPPQGDLSTNDHFEIELVRVRDRSTRIPLLVGHSAIWDGTSIVILGGGAVCFSFGTFWNEGVWLLHSDQWTDQKIWRQANRRGSVAVLETEEPAAKRRKLAIREVENETVEDNRVGKGPSGEVERLLQDKDLAGGRNIDESLATKGITPVPEIKVEDDIDIPNGLLTDVRATSHSSVKSKDQGRGRPMANVNNVVVPRFKVPLPILILPQTTKEAFHDCVRGFPPVLMENLDVGACTRLWTPEYLKSMVGTGRRVVVHESPTPSMNLANRNFNYRNISFGEFIDDIVAGRRFYLRSLSLASTARQPANFDVDFPTLAPDFRLPPALDFTRERFHSSVLRISGPVNMGLHYDVMANVLCQICGTKTILLYPPSDVVHLGIAPGASSSPLDAFDPNTADMESLKNTHPYEVILHPGDVLYIPPMWAHTVSANGSMSVAVNVFFRNLSWGYAAGRDIYGNRDLQPYEDGRRDVLRLASRFNGLPSEIGRFYLERLAQELHERAISIAVTNP